MRKNHIKNEKGALSFEFLGILPFYFLFFLLLWQVVATGYSVMTAKSAVNDAAKIYAATNEYSQARDAAQKAIGSSSAISFKDLSIAPSSGDGKFTVTLKSEHSLVFIPDKWRDKASMDLEMKAFGKVLVYESSY